MCRLERKKVYNAIIYIVVYHNIIGSVYEIYEFAHSSRISQDGFDQWVPMYLHFHIVKLTQTLGLEPFRLSHQCF